MEKTDFWGLVTQLGLVKAQWAQSGELLWCLRSHKPFTSLSPPFPQGFHTVFGRREGRVPEQPLQSCVAWAQLLTTLAAPGDAYLLAEAKMMTGLCVFCPLDGIPHKNTRSSHQVLHLLSMISTVVQGLMTDTGKASLKERGFSFLALCLFFFSIILGRSLSSLDGREERLYQNKLDSEFYLAAKATQSLSLTLSIS